MDSKKMRVGEEGRRASSQASPEDVRALIEPFSRDDLQKILEGAAVRYGDVLEDVRKVANRDPVHRKLFVRGLGPDLSLHAFTSSFSQFGEIEDATVIVDKASGKGKGYGFVTFLHMDSALRALREPMKKIDGRSTYCQLASEGPSTPADIAARKIYVGSVPLDTDADPLLEFFAQYGDIEIGPLGFDPKTGKSRGYAIFVYKTPEGAKRALEEPVKIMNGHHLYCKYALEKFRTGDLSQPNPDGMNLASLQPANALVAASSIYQNALAGTLSANPTLNLGLHNPAITTSYTPSIVPQLALSLGNPILNSPLNATSLAAAHGLGAYGSAIGGSSTYAASLGGSLYGNTAPLSGAAGHLSPYHSSQAARTAEPQLQSLYYSR